MQITATDPYNIRQALAHQPAAQGTPSKWWTREEIAAKLQANDAWLIRGLLALHARQTSTERLGQHTQDLNGLGFNRADAPLLSSYAEQIKAWERGESRYRLPLSPAQLAVARRRMAKYTEQLARYANRLA